VGRGDDGWWCRVVTGTEREGGWMVGFGCLDLGMACATILHGDDGEDGDKDGNGDGVQG
jgi:hypothetical protein